MAESLSILEKRLSDLESRIYGKHEEDIGDNNCIDSLVNIHNKIQSTVASRERICQMLKKIDEIKRLLDSEGTDELLSESAKLAILLAEEDKIRETLDCLQKVEDLKHVLDSEHIKATPTLGPKLVALSEIQLQQEKQVAEMNDNVRNLLGSYNSVIHTLSKQFVLWDETITKLEIQSQPKKRLE